MKRGIIYLLLVPVILVLGCSEERESLPAAPAGQETFSSEAEAEALALALVTEAGWPLEDDQEVLGAEAQCHGPHIPLCGFERSHIVGDVFHYYVEIPIGPGVYDKIGLHRVVRESRPHRPIRTSKTFFYQHGDCKDFVGMVLPGLVGETTPIDFGLAVYLAQHDVDVWGIDQSWCFVPIDETNFAFMEDWGLQWATDNLSLAMYIARFARAMTGNGLKKMNLCGYSSGVWSGYALLNQETQLPRGLRNVKGFIPVDAPFKTDDEPMRILFCEDMGIYPPQPNYYIGFNDLGQYALDDPTGMSPFEPTMTNEQFAMFCVSATIYFTPTFHYNAALYDPGTGLPYDLTFTNKIRLFEFLASAIIWQPVTWFLDCDKLVCDEEDVPFDDYLSEIDVPILDVTAAGGFGELMYYSSGLTSSHDVSSLLVRMLSVGEEDMDFAHIDIFTATDAPSLVFQPILEWIEAHD